jgi:phosphatidylglycerophosphate synthase
MLAEAARGLLQRVLGPLAARLPHLDPNTLTLFGLCIAVGAGWALSKTDEAPAYFLVAAGLSAVYGLVDAFDGVLARTQGKVTPLGDFLDHTFDRLSALSALGGLALAHHTNDVLVLVLMLATLWHGFLGTQLEASFGRRLYAGVGIGEALVLGFGFCLFSFWLLETGRPYWFTVCGLTLSVSDAFALAGLPVVALGTVQRFLLARRLARETAPA